MRIICLCLQRKDLNTTEFEITDNKVDCLWVRVTGKANKPDILVRIWYRTPNQDEEVVVLFYKQLEDVSGSQALVLIGDFNLPNVCWELNTVVDWWQWMMRELADEITKMLSVIYHQSRLIGEVLEDWRC
ncbi:hypothetical protein HGM15179_018777 [Zosterops borbonicus]|uniref:Endonuclease/exonuclease/phosphatase domain-containing protein n=1 Tax=Zosterops borbonicus TaxID=364589 RepID=A0A8K1DB19_9PASS|nr:hypothetical protein HGM15179_018777 [Zosterops borbonicus]